MSFFIRAIPVAVLISRPPVSKQTPLPTSVTRGFPFVPQRISSRRGATALARPTVWISGKFFSRRSSPTIEVTSAP